MTERTTITQNILAALWRCPLSGAWLKSREVSISLTPPVDQPPGWNPRRRLDVAFLELQRRKANSQFRVLAVEVKSCRADFAVDGKWREYADRVHGLAFACPTGVITADELPNDLGLYYYSAVWHEPTCRPPSWQGRISAVRHPKMKDAIDIVALADLYRGMLVANNDKEPWPKHYQPEANP